MAITNILFDMGGVVTLQDSAEAKRRFRELGVDTDEWLGKYGHKGIFGDLEAGKIGTDEFCVELAKIIGRESVSWQEACHCWLGFKKSAPVERLHHLLELKKCYRLYLLSNTNPFMMSVAKSTAFSSDGQPITHYFHDLFLSYELKVCKPDREIYLRALAKGSLKAEECLFIDDSLANIQAAEALGIHGLHIETNEDWWEKLLVHLNNDKRE